MNSFIGSNIAITKNENGIQNNKIHSYIPKDQVRTLNNDNHVQFFDTALTFQLALSLQTYLLVHYLRVVNLKITKLFMF